MFKLVGIIALLCCLNLRTFSQSADIFLEKKSMEMEKYFNAHPIEKVYLHLSQSTLSLSDTLRFKAYVTLQNQQISNLSGVLYLELYSNIGSIIKRIAVPLDSGIANGLIPINVLQPGLYTLRAFTNWMRNFDEQYFYHQQLKIGNSDSANGITAAITQKLDSLTFFPEGGHLVEGLRSRVAVLALDQNGLGVATQGSLLDEAGTIVSNFETNQNGLGGFAFTPKSAKQYHVVSSLEGNIKIATFPLVSNKGFSYLINNNAQDSLLVKIAANDIQLKEKRDSLFYVLAQSEGKICYASRFRLTNQLYVIKIDKKTLPGGVVQFLVVNSNGEVKNERLCFNQLTGTLSSEVKFKSDGNHTAIDMRVFDDQNSPISGNFSVAIYDKPPIVHSMTDQLFLTAETERYTKFDESYLLTQGSEKSDLDLYMITQRSRGYRFDDKDLMFLPEVGFEVSGYLKTSLGQPVKNEKIELYIPEADVALDTVTNEQGHFAFYHLNIFGTVNAVLKATSPNGSKDIQIFVKEPSTPPITLHRSFQTEHAVKVEIPSNGNPDSTVFFNNGRTNVLKTVIVKGKKTEDPDLKTNLNGADHQFTISGKDLQDHGSLLQGLIVKLPGVFYKDGKFYKRSNELHLVIDGKVEEPDALQRIEPSDIENVKLLEGGIYKTLYGIGYTGVNNKTVGVGIKSSDDIILVTTKQYVGKFKSTSPKYKKVNLYSSGDPAEKETLSKNFSSYVTTDGSKSGFITLPLTGFENPEYTNVEPKNSTDHLVYWNATIKINSENDSKPFYFETKPNTTYYIVLEGIDRKGRPLQVVKKYTSP
jgi:hypothetical protein